MGDGHNMLVTRPFHDLGKAVADALAEVASALSAKLYQVVSKRDLNLQKIAGFALERAKVRLSQVIETLVRHVLVTRDLTKRLS